MSRREHLNADQRVELARYVDAARSLEGWELEFEPEPIDDAPPWDYEALARELATAAHSVLDLGTGGGEVFSRILGESRSRGDTPRCAVATEPWHVNAPVAAKRLAGRAHVLRTSSLRLPFASGSFELVLDRHEELDPAEVSRVLVPGARLLTQQVDAEYWPELRAFFPDMPRFPDHYVGYPRALLEAGGTIEIARRSWRKVRFDRLGPLVYQLTAAPWILPGFSLETHEHGLGQLDARMRRDGGLVLGEGFYLLQFRSAD